MIKKITNKELIVFQMLRHPKCSTEILFSNLGNLAEFNINEFSEVRKYQLPYHSWDTLYIEDKNLSNKENYKIQNGLAEKYILGGRLTGKSLLGLIVDCLLALLNKTFRKASVSSADAEKIKKVMEQIFVALEYHPIFKLLNIRVKRNPYQALHPKGVTLESVNNNISGKNPGGNYHGRHDDKNWEEEASYLTNTVTHEKLMAQAERGCIKHYTGMTTFAKESPMGKIFNKLENRNKIVNVPSFANPTWNEEKDEEAQREFGGKSSAGYLVQIVGKIIENSESVFDIEEIRKTYLLDKKGMGNPIKSFEVNKNNFFRYKESLILEKPINAEKMLLCADIGEGGSPSEYIVLALINGIYRYIYNITTFKITPEQEKELAKYLMELLKVNIFGIDNTSGVGKAIFSYISTFYPDNIIAVDFNKKIAIDYERDEANEIKYDKDGNPIPKEEMIVDWSIQCLKNIFYGKRIQCLYDTKLDAQFDGVVTLKSGMKTLYKNKTVNHLFQAFQVFAIIDWQINGLATIVPVQQNKTSFGVFN